MFLLLFERFLYMYAAEYMSCGRGLVLGVLLIIQRVTVVMRDWPATHPGTCQCRVKLICLQHLQTHTHTHTDTHTISISHR